MQVVSGDLFEADVDAIVNTVNCVGVMGKGLALAVKRRYPEAYREYVIACVAGKLDIGKVLTYEIPEGRHRFLIHVPTKKHWQFPSKMPWIQKGVRALITELQARQIKSVAVPALGCGEGGLRWESVAPLIWQLFQAYAPDIDLVLYAPAPGRSVTSHTGPITGQVDGSGSAQTEPTPVAGC